MYFSAAIADGTATPFYFFHKRYVRGLHLLRLFYRACWLVDVQIVEVGHEPFGHQDVGRLLLISDQLVFVQLRRYKLEPFLVRQEEEEACEVLLTDALHCLFLETILQCQFISRAHRCKRVGGDKVLIPEGQHMFVVHTVLEPISASVRVYIVHLRGEHLLEVVRALIRPLCAEIQIIAGLYGLHDDPLPVHIVEVQVSDKEQDRDDTPRILRCLRGVLVLQLRLDLLRAVLQNKVLSLHVVLVPVLQLGVVPPLIVELLIHGILIVDVVDHQDVHHAQGDPIVCLERVEYQSSQIRFWSAWLAIPASGPSGWS